MGFRHHGIVMLDLEGRITFANHFICDLVGITPEEAAGQSCFAFVFPEDLEAAKGLLEQNKAPLAKPFRFRLKHKNGSPIWVDIQGAPIKSANGPVFGILSAITPVHGNKSTGDIAN